MDIRQHFITRKTQGTVGREGLKKPAEKPAETSKLDLPPKNQSVSTKVPRNDCRLTRSAATPSAEIPAAINPREECPAPEPTSGEPMEAPKPPVNMTMAQFRANPNRKAAFKDFQNSVGILQKTPEKLQKSPFFSPHKTCLTPAQVIAKNRADQARKQLFTASPQAEPATEVSSEVTAPIPIDWGCEEPSWSASVEPPTLAYKPSTPVTTPRKVHFSVPDASPSKRMLLFSPSKGLVHATVKTAAQVVAEAASKAPGLADGTSMMSGLGGISGLKRKSEFDRADVKKSLAQFKTKTENYKTLLGSVKLPSVSALPSTYLQHAALASELRPKLPLPSRYKQLETLFEEIENIIRLMHNGDQSCYFDKLDESIRKYIKRPLIHEDLRQIKTFFPEAYYFKIEKPASIASSPGLDQRSAGKEHLAIYPRDDTIGVVDGPDDMRNMLKRRLTTDDMRRRKNKLHENLLRIVFEEHRDFLAANFPTSLPAEESQIVRWHIKFPLDSMELYHPTDLAELPQYSKPLIPRSAPEALQMMLAADGGARQPQLEMSKPHSPMKSPFKGGSKSPMKPKAVLALMHPALKRVDRELIARVSARVEKRLASRMVRPPHVDKRLKMLERLPNMCGIIIKFYVQENRTILPKDAVVAAIKRSVKGIFTDDEIKAHLELVMELFPSNEWLEEIIVSGCSYLERKTKKIGTIEIIAAMEKEKMHLNKT